MTNAPFCIVDNWDQSLKWAARNALCIELLKLDELTMSDGEDNEGEDTREIRFSERGGVWEFHTVFLFVKTMPLSKNLFHFR